jgi:hypothetical protein
MSETTTRKKIIIKKYNELLNNIKLVYTANKLLPSLDEYDIVELLFYFNYYFGSYKDDFNEPLREIIKTENIEITEDEYNKVYPLIHEFLINFKKLC